MRAAACFVLAAALGGCSVSYHYRDAELAEAVSGPIELILERVVVERNGAETGLGLDAPVYGGDNLALSVSARSPVYLYVVNLAPDGSSQVVWPSDVPQVIDGPLRIPEQSIPEQSWFRLSGEAGAEVVALVASRDYVPLSPRGVRHLVRLAKREARRGDLAKLQAAHPPGFFAEGHATMGLRARHLEPLGDGVRVQSGGPTAVLLIDLDHRAPR